MNRIPLNAADTCHEVVVENVVPVVLDFVATEGENKAGFRLDDEEVSYIERLNLLRFT